ncbi:MAG: hypothetical protein JWN92_2792 [Candidatus Acidoferrum typicum]|nr:hypothetical protein [Candidatus Acidoferrum typicum]
MPIKKNNSTMIHRRNKLGSRKSLLLYLTEEEHKTLQQAADSEATSMSGYIARVVLPHARRALAAERDKK